MRSFCSPLVLMLGIGALSLAAQTDVTVKKYHEWKVAERACELNPTCAPKLGVFEPRTWRLYIKGVGDGLVWANGFLQGQNHDRLYCQPEKIGLNGDNYDQILESFLPTMSTALKTMKSSTWKSIDDVPIGFVLVLALIDSFPCAAAK